MRLILVVLLALAGTAAADRAKAEQYFRAGERAFKAQNFAAAAESFELAFKELELPEIAFSAAQSYRRQFYIDPQPHYAKRALELYRGYLDKVKTGGRVADASDGLAEMQRELDKLGGGKSVAGIPRGTRMIVNAVIEGQDRTSMTELSMVPGAEQLKATASLDGVAVKLGAPTDVSPGEHTIEVKAEGYFAITLKKRVEEGATEVAEAVLRPKPAKLTMKVESGARITIDGRVASSVQEIPAGKHVIVVSRSGREPIVRELTIARGEERTLDLPMATTRQRKASKWLALGTAVLGATTIGVMAIAIGADQEMQRLETKREEVGITDEELDRYRRQVRKRDQNRDAAWGLGGATLAAGTIAAALFYFDNPTPEGTRLVPVVGTDGAGVSVVGRF